MAGHARYTALLDACVLYPITIADALLSLSCSGLFAAKWTRQIEDEWVRNLEKARPDLTGKLGRRVEAMRRAAPDWEVAEEQYGALMPCLTLPDQNDIHVLAAAIAGHADCIVTKNLKDYPKALLAMHGIEVIHPDDFMVMQLDLDAVAGLTALKDMRNRRKAPPYTPEAFAQLFERCELFSTALRMREAAALI